MPVVPQAPAIRSGSKFGEHQPQTAAEEVPVAVAVVLDLKYGRSPVCQRSQTPQQPIDSAVQEHSAAVSAVRLDRCQDHVGVGLDRGSVVGTQRLTQFAE